MKEHEPATLLSDRNSVLRDIDQMLGEYFDGLLERAGAIHPRYKELVRTIMDSALPGGKRNRPYLCLLAAAAFGSKDYQRDLRASLFLELIHMAALIHDDIIDKDTIRHDRLNVKGRYEQIYAAAGVNDPRHYSDSAALIAGDILISESFEHIRRTNLPNKLRDELAGLLADSNFRLFGGELLDTDAVIYGSDEEDSMVINVNKTAFYSFVLPLTSGALIAGAHETEIALLQEAAKALGAAFQLTDDLRGTFGNPHDTGKSSEGDITEGKRTLLYIKSLDLAKGSDKEYLNERYGALDLNSEEIGRIKSILAGCGAKAYVEQEISRCLQKAEQQLRNVNIHASYRSAIIRVVAEDYAKQVRTNTWK